MTLDPSWAGLIGTFAGGALGIVGTLATQWRESDTRKGEWKRQTDHDDEVRREEQKREDHLREIDRRREAYIDALRTLYATEQLMSKYYLMENGDFAPSDRAAARETYQSVEALRANLELLAPRAITEPVSEVSRCVVDLMLGMDNMARTDSDPSDEAPLITVRRLISEITVAMRQDLRIVEPASVAAQAAPLPAS